MRRIEPNSSWQTNLKNWVNTERHGGRPLHVGEEVRHAGDDAGGRLRSNLLQGPGEDGQAAAGQRLSCFQSWICATTVLVDMIPDVGITHDREDARHDIGFLLLN